MRSSALICCVFTRVAETENLEQIFFSTHCWMDARMLFWTSTSVEPLRAEAGVILDRRSSHSFEPMGQPPQISAASRSPHQPQRALLSGSRNSSVSEASPLVPSAPQTAVASACVSSSVPFGSSDQSSVTEYFG